MRVTTFFINEESYVLRNRFFTLPPIGGFNNKYKSEDADNEDRWIFQHYFQDVIDAKNA